MRLFLAIKKDEKQKEYISDVIKSDSYPSTYTFENPDARIIELPKIEENSKQVSCHIYF